jgi:hypothetical protein
MSLTAAPAFARDSALTAIPADAIAFAVVHNIADASSSIAEVAKLVQAPAPDLLTLAKGMTGLQKGLDEQGDLAIVVTSVDLPPKVMVLIPVTNFDDFFAALNVKPPATGVVDAQLVGSPVVVGRKGNFAAITRGTDRAALEQFIASTANLAADASLAGWVDANKVSIAVPSSGIKILIPKLTAAIIGLQAQIRMNPDPKVQTAAGAFNMYLSALTAAEPEVDQFGIGVRIDSAHSVDFVSRLQFTSGGSWANWAATAPAMNDSLLAGLPAGPYVAAIGAIVPPNAVQQLMKFSVQMMQANPMFNLTPEQAQQYGQLTSDMMSGLRSMRMLVGVSDPSTGLFSNTSAIMIVDDAKSFMERYEKSIAAVRELVEQAKSSAIPVATAKRIKIGDVDALEVTTDMANLEQPTAPGAPDPKKVQQLIFGAEGKMVAYMAAADEHAVVMTYTSPDKLKAAIDFYKSKQPGLSNDANIAKIAAALPAGSQLIGYLNLSTAAKVARQFVGAAIPNGRPAAIPDFADSPPIGMATKITATGAEGHCLVTSDTLRSIGEAVAKTRGAAPAPAAPPK